jgi:hypothetical protein
MTEVNVMTEQEDEKKFADILLLLITVQSLVALELVANVGQLFVDTFHFRLFAFACRKQHEPNRVKAKLKSVEIARHLQLRMSDMKTAKPRMPSPRTAGIMKVGGFCTLNANRRRRDDEEPDLPFDLTSSQDF